MTIAQLSRQINALVTPIYGADDAPWIVRIIFEYLKGWSQTELLIRQTDEASDFLVTQAMDIARQTAAGKPIQYVLGETYWHGMKLTVGPDVLIPRPETSQLVDIITDRYRERTDLKVLDLCTGSGCIAIALARDLRFSNVSGGDISPEALVFARDNAKALKVGIDFFECDVTLPLPLPSDVFDIVVANPPYVLESEKNEMSRHVIDNEPAKALFVPDDDALRFYIPIAKESRRILKPGGSLFFEINPICKDALTEMLKIEGFAEITVERDMFGRQRFITALKP